MSTKPAYKDYGLIVKQAREHLSKLEREQNDRLDSIRREIDHARQTHRPATVIVDLENKLSTQRSLAERYIAQQRAKVAEAEESERQQAELAENTRMAKEQALKELYLKEWTRKGGSADEFELSWPAMNRERLEKEVAAELARAPENNPKGSILG